MRSAIILCIIIFSVCAGYASFGQQIKVSASFLTDSSAVGKEVLMGVSARYPSELQIVFPDSAYNFAPFELRKKRYFITETKNNISVDSAVYHFTTFEIDSIQRLRIPVFAINALDCTRVYSNWDTLYLQQLVKDLPEEINARLPVKSNHGYVEVPTLFNYPVIIIGLCLLLLLALMVWLVFGDKIRRYLRVRKMQKAHERFVLNYNSQVDLVKQKFSPALTESAIVLWKNYMEEINARPYTKLTSLETGLLERDEHLVDNLRKVDAAIYGNNQQVVDSLEHLRGFADKKFRTILEEVRHD